MFLDIETVPQQPGYEQLGDDWKALWQTKAMILLRNREGETPESIYERAGIYAEFGKIICISCGVMHGSENSRKLVLKSFADTDEKQLLSNFCEMLVKWGSNEPKYLCAHNGKEFDFPYICRRLIINGMPIPTILNIAGKKPWEVSHLDTMELWKFGDYKSYTSLNLLAFSLGVPTPKDDIDGSMVAQVYYEEKNLDRIVTYCQKDVITLAQIFLRFNGEQLLPSEAIEIK
ncbi:3'-5' exonuclease [Niabella ginsengisoli]|uniref:3'-5' exonuclease n=1 Tax=Niabella ginsengisoli TaxID=522298 RepID=A0ABS9SNF0_9BACT|nr:3'-5' exonuclease [Niabella ginsengisoli]MCH5599933.1 3'-5' exonuclease [Niabella ginsengisoli]